MGLPVYQDGTNHANALLSGNNQTDTIGQKNLNLIGQCWMNLGGRGSVKYNLHKITRNNWLGFPGLFPDPGP
jgi:hypothetical protein